MGGGAATAGRAYHRMKWEVSLPTLSAPRAPVADIYAYMRRLSPPPAGSELGDALGDHLAAVLVHRVGDGGDGPGDEQLVLGHRRTPEAGAERAQHPRVGAERREQPVGELAIGVEAVEDDPGQADRLREVGVEVERR